MKKAYIILILILFGFNSAMCKYDKDLLTQFEKSNGLETATYHQVIEYYQILADKFSQINLKVMGKTDSGLPLHLITYNKDGIHDLPEMRKNKRIILINNGIHPGESDGIDATMMLFRDLAQANVTVPINVVIATIPIYNIGGSLNRNSTTRTNQNGPKSYGFRGNARNFDLNRDFIKNDTLNAQSFAKIFHALKPDVFIDNHVSNGADYQYTLTHLMTQHNKLGGVLGEYLHETLMPKLEIKLKLIHWDITPYVNVFNKKPELGFSQFMDYSRYSTGYTSLFNVLGMMVETHMLKPYKQRVEGTYQLMLSMIEIVDSDSEKIKSLRLDYYKNIYAQKEYTLDWEVNRNESTILDFKGYEATRVKSKVTHAQRLKYQRDKPFTKPLKYQNQFQPKLQVTIPKAYIIPQGWHNVLKLLRLNQVEMRQLEDDKSYLVESYKITDFETKKQAYEGHYLHSKTQISSTSKQLEFKKGDYIVQLNQPSIRYIIETLEPQAPDSFFNWNFFDSILQQKEGFSPYVFEEVAENILANYPEIAQKFDKKLKNDNTFSENWYAQLDWIHKQSVYYEKSHNQYPVYRILKKK